MVEFKSYRSYWDFARAVQSQRRYFREAEVEEFLNTVIATSESRVITIPAGTGPWHAQRGCNWQPIYQDEEYIADVPRPY